MTTQPARSRATLTDISSRAWEHPADRGALVALRKLKGFDTLLKAMSGLFNERAVRLWQSLGFGIVGRLPGAFEHPSQGFVDALVMFKQL